MVMFWLLAAILCAGVVLLLLSSGGQNEAINSGRNDAALAIYKDQLIELDRDVASGVIAGDEAEAQRTEISRRLLAVGRETQTQVSSSSFPKYLVLAVPLLAALLYSQVGRYGLPDVPRAERLAAAETTNDWDALIARVEQQLEKDPSDLEGWKLLVPNYLNIGRYGDAANAMGKIAALQGPSPELYANMAEALVFENNGLVTPRSIALVDGALKLDGKHPKALYYHGLALAQEGKSEDAKATFKTLLALAPPDAPWRGNVEKQLAKLEPNAAAPKLSPEQMQNATSMTPEDRMAMIRSMVDGLDEKLKANPDDVEGWLRLIRARVVLNEPENAAMAFETARNRFAAKPDTLKLIDALASELNLK
jgi:cytochrome c-type biogenesis protein CcmH